MQSLVTDAQLHGAIAAFIVTWTCHGLYIGTAYRYDLQLWRTRKHIWLATLSVFLGAGLVLAVIFAFAKHGPLCHDLERGLLLGWQIAIFLPNLIVQVLLRLSIY